MSSWVVLEGTPAAPPDLGTVLRRLALADPAVSLSVGWALSHQGETAEQVVARADAAMYRIRHEARTG